MIYLRGKTTKAQRRVAERILKDMQDLYGLTKLDATIKAGIIEITGNDSPYEKVTIDLTNVDSSKVKVTYGSLKEDTAECNARGLSFTHSLEESIMETYGGEVPKKLPAPTSQPLTAFPLRHRLRQIVN